MNCQDISKLIYQYCDGEVSPEENANISQHLDFCPYCQYICELTMLENEVLRDKDDIPHLSPAFTSLVMSSLQSPDNNNTKNRFSRFNRKVWLSSMTTVAAVVALFLYLPHPSFFDLNIPLYNNASIHEQSSSNPSIAYDSQTLAGHSNLTDSSKSVDSKDTTPVAPPIIIKTAPVPDNLLNQSLFIATTESSAEIKPTVTLDSSRSIYYDRATESSSISLRPQNIPDRLNFVQTNNYENKTVFDYTSIDGKECLQITLVPYIEPTSGSKTEIKPPEQDPLTVTKDIQIADEKITVIFSGNLPMEEMTILADTIQFPDTPSN